MRADKVHAEEAAKTICFNHMLTVALSMKEWFFWFADEQARKEGRFIYGIQLVDHAGHNEEGRKGLWRVAAVRAVLKNNIVLSELLYPEDMIRTIMVNPPIMLRLGLSLMKAVMRTGQFAKIRVLRIEVSIVCLRLLF